MLAMSSRPSTDLTSWESDLPFSLRVDPGTVREVLATMSVLRRGLVEPLTGCRLRDFQTIPVGRTLKTLLVNQALTWSTLRLVENKTAKDSSSSRLLPI